MTDADTADNFPGNSASSKFEQKVTATKGADRTKNVEILVPLKYLSNFWKALEMPLINCEINLTLTWSEKCIISSAADT